MTMEHHHLLIEDTSPNGWVFHLSLVRFPGLVVDVCVLNLGKYTIYIYYIHGSYESATKRIR